MPELRPGEAFSGISPECSLPRRPAGTYLRCVGFANEQLGWVGTLDQAHRLFHTADGGASWTEVSDLPPGAPSAICGLSVVDERVIWACGTNFPDEPAAVVRSTDSGASWSAIGLAEHASLLVDVFFADERRGWVVGGKAEVPDPSREDVTPVVLATEDAGGTWVNRLEGTAAELPKGEWGWKIQFVSEDVGFVSLESFRHGAILKTVDGGVTWARKTVDDPQGNANLEGIGFLNSDVGWAGGWGDELFVSGYTSETRDGGETWSNANHVGRYLNRFRFLQEPELVGYACGDTVYRYSATPAMADEPTSNDEGEQVLLRSFLPVRIPLPQRSSAERVRVDIWDRFGRHLATPLDDAVPAAGLREVSWDGETESGRWVGDEVVLYRVTVGDQAVSQAVLIET
jgi:photosystem II stability/assembly factor-like uncharacterized protein